MGCVVDENGHGELLGGWRCDVVRWTWPVGGVLRVQEDEEGGVCSGLDAWMERRCRVCTAKEALLTLAGEEESSSRRGAAITTM